MPGLPPCPECTSPYTYEDRGLLVCPECAHEWTAEQAAAEAEAAQPKERVYRDSVGAILQDGDSVVVIKDLRMRGSSGVVKQGTHVRNIRLVDEDHDIDCRIDGLGAMKLKSEFVKKV